MKNYKKLLLIPIFAFLLITFAKAQSQNGLSHRPDISNKDDNGQNFDRDNKIEEIFGKVNKEDLKLYIGFTNNSELNQKIKTLRENYKDKIEALRKQYVIDLKNLVKDARLDNSSSTVATSTNSSSTATGTKPIRWSDNSKGLHLGFWEKVKNWLGFNN